MRTLILLMFILIGTMQLRAQTLIISQHGASEDSVLLNNVQKISFDSNTFQLHLNNGTTSQIALSEIQKIYFKADSLSPVFSVKNFNKMQIIPNPVESMAELINIPIGSTSIAVYSIFGIQLMWTGISSTKEKLDLSSLSGGIYILNVNDQVIKFIKL